ncbi:hypothetical protein ACIPPQ_18215 [Sphingopyxis sp. LARHCG72]|jgi:hypothetical protein
MTYRSSTRLFLFVTLALFAMGYVFRYFFLSHYLGSNSSLPPEYLDWQNVNIAPLGSAMMICSAIFATYFIIHVATTRSVDRQPPNYIRLPYWAFAALGGFIVASLAVRAQYGAALGQEAAADAGFIFGTLNYRIQSDLIPPLILLVMEVAWRHQDKVQYYLGIATLAAFFIILSAITTSKAGMVFFLAQLIMLMYLTGQNLLKYPMRITLGGLAGVLAFIIGSQLRAQALGAGDSAIWVSLKDGHFADTLFQVVGLIANRIPGVEGLALSCGIDCDTLPGFHLPSLARSAADIFTYDIIRVQWANDFRSPGLVGGAVLLTGLWGGVAMVLGFLFAAKSICSTMDRFRFSAAASAAFVYGILRIMMEGAWYWVDFVTMLAGVIATEAVSRLLIARKSSKSDSELTPQPA